MSETPRTDAVRNTPIMGETVTNHKWDEMTKLSRQLEAELYVARAKLNRYARLSESGESLGGELEERERRMELESTLERLTQERDRTVAETAERCAAKIRNECGHCDGTGLAGYDDEILCPYCGWQVDAIRSLKV